MAQCWPDDSGHVFGNNPRWHFQSKSLYPYQGTWEQSLEDPDRYFDLGTLQMSYFGEILRRIPWEKLAPDSSGAFLTKGKGEGPDRAAGAVDAAEGIALVYTVSTSTITLDLSQLAAVPTVVVRRVDPTSSKSTDIGTYPTNSSRSFDHPGRNSHADADWLYILTPN